MEQHKIRTLDDAGLLYSENELNDTYQIENERKAA